MRGIKICQNCKGEFSPIRSNGYFYGPKQFSEIKFCSIKCLSKWFGLTRKGKHYSLKTEFKIGRIPPNKGTRKIRKKIHPKTPDGSRPWMCGDNNPARKPGVGEKISKAKTGHKGYHLICSNPIERSRKISIALLKHYDKIGRKKFRNSCHLHRKPYCDWRKSVFTYDNYICWICEEKGGCLNAHHLKQWSYYPKLRYKISNGITLCNLCHRTYGNHKKRRR